ncbi:conserved exported hypothetical protein [uncultured Desulfatiglans sp.]|uniref:Protein BatD n=1 Tax=Uncultured Desulfatiglans sp. TaxID=1748965 RepID=A0A653AIC8_UNCDX|nr:conserved exported hypothetical protein [uncultured Desulfatiglans sp.]
MMHLFRIAVMLVAWLWVSGAPATGFAEEAALSIHLDRREATLNDTLKLTVHIAGAEDAPRPAEIPGLEDFVVTSGGTSSQIRMDHTGVLKSSEHVYFIQPKKTGRFSIGPASLTIDGIQHASNILALTIEAPSSNDQTPSGPVFLTAELDRPHVYVEQSAVYILRLYLKARAGDLSLALPESDHLSFQQLGNPSEYRTMIEGERWQAVEVRYSVTPSAPGRYAIPPSRVRMTLYEAGRNPRRGFFDDPLFSSSRGRPVTVRSGPVELQVSPLPEDGRPGRFSGLVGDFRMQARLDPASLRAGESATLTVTIEGRGNVQRIPDLSLPAIEHVKTYGDQPSLEYRDGEDGPEAVKTMKWALVPEMPGRYDIPPLTLDFFDPSAGRYRTIEAPPLALEVSHGNQAEAGSQTPATRTSPPPEDETGPAALGEDILPVHTTPLTLSRGGRLPPNPLHAGLVLLGPALAVGAVCILVRLRRRSSLAASRMRARKAARRFFAHFGNGGLSAEELEAALRDYLNDRFQLSLGVLTPHEAAAILKARGVRKDLAARFSALAAEVDRALYTGKGQTAAGTREDIPDLIQQIEKELP